MSQSEHCRSQSQSQSDSDQLTLSLSLIQAQSRPRSSLYSLTSLLEFYINAQAHDHLDRSSPEPLSPQNFKPIPRITFSSSSDDSDSLPRSPDALLTVGQHNMPFTQKIDALCSRLKFAKPAPQQPIPSTPEITPSATSSHQTPPPLKVPPSSMAGVRVDHRSWVDSDDSSSESDDETLVKNHIAPVSLGHDDEVPLSKLRKAGTGCLTSPSTGTTLDRSVPENRIHPGSLAHVQSHQSMRTLYQKQDCLLAPSTPLDQQSPSSNQHTPDRPLHHPTQFPNPIRSLRPAMSSPNLSDEKLRTLQTRFNPNSYPMPTAPPSQVSGITSVPYPLFRGHQRFPSQPSQLYTPPSSISPPARVQKLRPPQSLIFAGGNDKDVHRRMKQRHKEEMQNFCITPPPPSSVNIDPSLYSMLTEPQRVTLRQRSDMLGLNLKMHLEALAYEMVQANVMHQGFHGAVA